MIPETLITYIETAIIPRYKEFAAGSLKILAVYPDEDKEDVYKRQVRAPVNSFEFHRCRRTPQVEYLSLIHISVFPYWRSRVVPASSFTIA